VVRSESLPPTRATCAEFENGFFYNQRFKSEHSAQLAHLEAMKPLVAILLPLICATAASTPAIDSLVESARAAPAEFAADALIRLAALDQVDKARKIEWLQQAFDRAAEAQEPYKRRAAITRFGGPAGFLNRAYSQDLDAMSLRLRAVAALLPVDSRKAASLFLRIPPARLPAVSCTEFLVPEVSRFYEVLGNLLASQALTSNDLERFAGAITSPGQIAPTARMIASANLSEADFRRVVAAYAGALSGIAADDRTFTYYAAAGRQIELLAEECRRHKTSTLPLVEAYRAYLVRHLSGARCGDDELQKPTGLSLGMATPEEADAKAADAPEFFNQRLVVPPVQAIGELDATPSKLEGTAIGLRSCEDAACKAIAEQFHALVFNSVGVPFQQSEKDTPEWRSRLQTFLKAVADWKPGPGVTPAAHFREKCGLYSDLSAVPNPPDREAVLRALFEFTSRNAFQVKNRVEWFLPVNGLIGRAGLDPVGLGRIIDLLRKSDDPVIALFANLEVVAPRAPDRVLPLL